MECFMRRLKIMILAISGLCSAMLSVNLAAVEVTVQEWLVPWENSRPRDPFVAPDGRVWFVGQADDYAAIFDPDKETFERIDLEAGTGPHNLIVGAGGMVWYAGNKLAHIGRIEPATHAIKQFPMPEETAADPHTLIEADNGNIWFTAQHSNSVGHFDPESGESSIIMVPTAKARPYGIKLDSKNEPWVVLLGTNKLLHVDASTLAVSEVELPRASARPRRLEITSDGSVWYVDYAEGYLGRYRPRTGTFEEWPTPGRKDSGVTGSGPYGMAHDSSDRIWFVETFPAPNRLIGFDPETETFFSKTDIPSGAGSVRHMYFDTKTNSIWFGTDTNRIAQARIDE